MSDAWLCLRRWQTSSSWWQTHENDWYEDDAWWQTQENDRYEDDVENNWYERWLHEQAWQQQEQQMMQEEQEQAEQEREHRSCEQMEKKPTTKKTKTQNPRTRAATPKKMKKKPTANPKKAKNKGKQEGSMTWKRIRLCQRNEFNSGYEDLNGSGRQYTSQASDGPWVITRTSL